MHPDAQRLASQRTAGRGSEGARERGGIRCRPPTAPGGGIRHPSSGMPRPGPGANPWRGGLRANGGAIDPGSEPSPTGQNAARERPSTREAQAASLSPGSRLPLEFFPPGASPDEAGRPLACRWKSVAKPPQSGFQRSKCAPRKPRHRFPKPQNDCRRSSLPRKMAILCQALGIR